MTTNQTIQSLAGDVRKQFVRKTRDNGESYWVRKSSSEDWIQQLCHDAHGDMMPDDWRYSFIVDALDAIEDHEDTDDARDSIEADIYTSELTGWLHSRADRYSYCDDAAEEYGANDAGLIDRLQMGQLAEKREVFDAVLSSLQDRLNESEDE